jgi:hypothetical protein
MAGAWLIVVIVEIGISRRRARTARWAAPAKEAAPAAPPPSRPPVAVRPEAKPIERRPEPRPEPQPPPQRIAAVPPPPEPEPQPEPEPEPEPERVVAFTPVSDGPRQWNLWELERAARAHAGGDVARDEERSYLLMYLREFAGPDGMLPPDFDGLVRDAFGDVLHTVGT